MIRNISFLFLAVFLYLSMPSTFAQSTSAAGQIVVYHLNAAVQGRSACVQLYPAIPQPGWACLFQSNPLYKETGALLLSAYLTGKPIQLTFSDQKDSSGLFQILIAEGHQ